MDSRTVAALLAAAALGACATAPTEPPAADAGPSTGSQTADAEQESIYSAALGRAGLTARVASNGCTRRADFRLQVLDGYPAPTVILHRTRPDRCRTLAAGGADILFTWSELGLAPTSPIVLANPLAADPTPGR